MKKSIFSLRVKLAFAALLIAGFVFVGCTNPANSDSKKQDNQNGQSNSSTPVALTASDALVGKWVDAYKSVYEITVSDFKNYGEQ